MSSEAPAAARPHSRWNVPTWAVLAIAATAQLMVVLDVSVVFVALPSMRTDLNLSVQGQQWVVNAYTLTFAGFLLLGGRAGDYFGRKNIFIAGLTVFVLSSLAGGFAQDGWQLITARAVQGLGSAMLAPSTLSLLTTTYLEPRARARALGVWAAMGATGGAFGAVVGGVLTDLLSWRWVLFVNVPIGAALIAAAVIALVHSRGAATYGIRNLDLPGAITVTAGLALAIYAIVGTDSRPWTDVDTVLPLAAGVLLLVLFVVIESRTAAPLVPLRVFRLRTLTSANSVALFLGCAMFSSFFFISLYLQQVLHHSPLRGGLEAVPGGFSIMAGSFLASRLVGRLGPRRLIVIGTLCTATGMALLSLLPAHNNYPVGVLGPLILATPASGLSLVPMTVAATAGVPPHEAGLAAGLLNTSRQVGGAIGLAALATIAATKTRSALAAHDSVAKALSSGYDRAQLVGAGIALAGGLLALTLPKVVRPRPTEAEVSTNTVGRVASPITADARPA